MSWLLTNVVLTIISFALGMGVVVGYTRLIKDEVPIVRHFAISQVLVYGATAWRSLYWDLWWVFGPETIVDSVYDLTGGILINAFWISCYIVGAYHGLQALHQMLPERERPYWNWFTVPMYPPTWKLVRGFLVITRTMKRSFKKDRGETK